jgi:hypothetical protein
MTSALKAGVAPIDAVRRSARHLGVVGESDAVAEVTIALARDLERRHGVSLMNDGNALTRLAEAYVKALPSLRDRGKAEVNMPFLFVTPQGPQHFEATLTPASLAALLASPEPEAAPHPAVKGEASPAPPPKKRGWWPFG